MALGFINRVHGHYLCAAYKKFTSSSDHKCTLGGWNVGYCLHSSNNCSIIIASKVSIYTIGKLQIIVDSHN